MIPSGEGHKSCRFFATARRALFATTMKSCTYIPVNRFTEPLNRALGFRCATHHLDLADSQQMEEWQTLDLGLVYCFVKAYTYTEMKSSLKEIKELQELKIQLYPVHPAFLR